jgi:hypothetical protein
MIIAFVLPTNTDSCASVLIVLRIYRSYLSCFTLTIEIFNSQISFIKSAPTFLMSNFYLQKTHQIKCTQQPVWKYIYRTVHAFLYIFYTYSRVDKHIFYIWGKNNSQLQTISTLEKCCIQLFLNSLILKVSVEISVLTDGIHWCRCSRCDTLMYVQLLDFTGREPVDGIHWCNCSKGILRGGNQQIRFIDVGKAVGFYGKGNSRWDTLNWCRCSRWIFRGGNQQIGYIDVGAADGFYREGTSVGCYSWAVFDFAY